MPEAPTRKMKMTNSHSRNTNFDQEGYININKLSDALQRIICASLWGSIPQGYQSIHYPAFDLEIDGICLFLQRFKLAEVLRSEVCKIVFDDEIWTHRIAQPAELEYAQNGLIDYWDATPELLQMFESLES
jgi:hypothetical protein